MTDHNTWIHCLCPQKPCPPHPTASFLRSPSNKTASSPLNMGKAASPQGSSLPPALRMKPGSHDLFGNPRGTRGGHTKAAGLWFQWEVGGYQAPGHCHPAERAHCDGRGQSSHLAGEQHRCIEFSSDNVIEVPRCHRESQTSSFS